MTQNITTPSWQAKLVFRLFADGKNSYTEDDITRILTKGIYLRQTKEEVKELLNEKLIWEVTPDGYLICFRDSQPFSLE